MTVSSCSKLNVDFTFNFEEKPMDSGGPLPRPLTDLPEGTTGRVVSLDVRDEVDLQRLEIMGLCEGRTVEVVKRGDPMIVRVLGTRIGIAAELAGCATVHPHDDHP
jgi:Fe2+ transport system protein FeoA